MPIIRIRISSELNDLACSRRSNPVAAVIVGIARRNENSTASFLVNFNTCPPKIDAAARETPGIIEID